MEAGPRAEIDEQKYIDFSPGFPGLKDAMDYGHKDEQLVWKIVGPSRRDCIHHSCELQEKPGVCPFKGNDKSWRSLWEFKSELMWPFQTPISSAC